MFFPVKTTMTLCMKVHFTLCLLITPVVWGLTDDEIEMIRTRAASSNGRCGSSLEITADADYVTITTNHLPDHYWGCVNPNKPGPTEITYKLPRNPQFDTGDPYCVSPGTVALAKNGVSFYNPLAAGGVNAVEGATQEEFDCCDAHSSPGDSRLHYHKLPHTTGTCDNPVYDPSNPEPQFLGVAFDGFPIYSQWEGLETSRLDECHGGYLPDGRYAYVAVQNHFPYLLGCYKATPQYGSSHVRCPNAAYNEVCDCLYGQLTFERTTQFDKRTLATQAETNAKIYVRYMMGAIARVSEKESQKHDTTLTDDVDACYKRDCGYDVDYTDGVYNIIPPGGEGGPPGGGGGGGGGAGDGGDGEHLPDGSSSSKTSLSLVLMISGLLFSSL